VSILLSRARDLMEVREMGLNCDKDPRQMKKMRRTKEEGRLFHGLFGNKKDKKTKTPSLQTAVVSTTVVVRRESGRSSNSTFRSRSMNPKPRTAMQQKAR